MSWTQLTSAEDLPLISYHFEGSFWLFLQVPIYCVHQNGQTLFQSLKLSSESVSQQRDNLSKARFLIELKYEVKGNHL